MNFYLHASHLHRLPASRAQSPASAGRCFSVVFAIAKHSLMHSQIYCVIKPSMIQLNGHIIVSCPLLPNTKARQFHLRPCSRKRIAETKFHGNLLNKFFGVSWLGICIWRQWKAKLPRTHKHRQNGQPYFGQFLFGSQFSQLQHIPRPFEWTSSPS